MNAIIDAKPRQPKTDQAEIKQEHLSDFVLEIAKRSKNKSSGTRRYSLSSHRKKVADRRIMVAELAQKGATNEQIADVINEYGSLYLKEGQSYRITDVGRDKSFMMAKNRQELKEAQFDMLIAEITDLDIRQDVAEDVLEVALTKFHNEILESEPKQAGQLTASVTTALDHLHKISLRRAALVGLDAPKQQEHNVRQVTINLDMYQEAKGKLTEPLISLVDDDVIEGELLEIDENS